MKPLTIEQELEVYELALDKFKTTKLPYLCVCVDKAQQDLKYWSGDHKSAISENNGSVFYDNRPNIKKHAYHSWFRSRKARIAYMEKIIQITKDKINKP